MKILSFVLIFIFSAYSFKKGKNTEFVTKDNNVSQEISYLKNQNKKNKKNLEGLLQKSLEAYLTEKEDYKSSYVTHLFKSKYKKYKFNESAVESLSKLKRENLRRAREKIKLSESVLDEMKITPLFYFKSLDRVKIFKKDFIEKNNLIKIKCGFKRDKSYDCFKTENLIITDELFDKLLNDGEVSKSIGKGLIVNLVSIPLKSGSENKSEINTIVRMSFFLNGVILESGDI